MEKKISHIALVWRKLDNVPGGVENFSIKLANEMISRGHKVSFFTWDKQEAIPFFLLDERVNWVKLNIGNPNERARWTTRVTRFIKFRKNLKKTSPNVILVFESGIFLVVRLFLLGLNFRIVLAERNSPSKHQFISNKWKIFSFIAHHIANEIVFQFSRYVEFLPKYLHKKIISIPNPVFRIEKNEENSKKKQKNILFIGRLAYQKNVKALIDAFKLLTENYSDWNLIIVGDGPEKLSLLKLSEESGQSKRTIFMDSIYDVQELYSQTDIFCIPSLYEGFPNTLAEALAHGIPSIGFKNCCGVTDLIDDGVNGLLCPGAMTGDNLKPYLESLMRNSRLRSKMKEKARNSILKFDPKEVYNLWENLFLKGL